MSGVVIMLGAKPHARFNFVLFRRLLLPSIKTKYQRAVRDVEFHLRLALASASKPGTGPEGEEIARTAAERLALLLCQEGRNKEAAKILKRQGFR